MTRLPDEGDSTSDDRSSRQRKRSAPAVVGPSDVADEVKEVLKAAFERPEANDGSKRSADPSRRGVSPATSIDETGPVDVMREHGVSDVEAAPIPRERRRFRDIAREHDTRIKAQRPSTSAEPAGARVAGTSSGTMVPADPKESTRREKSSQTETTVSDGGKKRVVITDEEVLNIKRAAPKEDRERKKTRRRSDEVTRLPNRRWWSRTADGRWRLRWYSVVGVVLAALVLVLLLLTSPLLSIRNIVVEGNVYTNQARLDEVLGQLKGDAILTADLHGASRQIEAIPWVRKARVSMHLPSRVVVQIDEREPAAFFRAVDGFIRVIDGEGRILDVIEGDPVEYVRIIGSGPNLAPGDFVGQPFLGAIELLGSLPVSLEDRLVSATVSPEGEISLQLSPNLLIIFGQPSDFQVKLVAVVNEMKRQGSRSYTVIDVSTGEPNVR
jgi:cell division protein FtsQ